MTTTPTDRRPRLRRERMTNATGPLESSLIGVFEVKLILLDRPGWSSRSRGSRASLRGRRRTAAWWGQEGEARCLNLFHDLAGNLPAGSGLSTRSSCPSSPRERSASPSGANSLCSSCLLRLLPGRWSCRPACRSGTRFRRFTCDAARRRACGRRRPGHGPCPGPSRSSCPRPAGSTICGCARANYGQPRRAPSARVHRRIG